MKKIGFAFVIFVFASCLFSPGPLSAVYAQDSPIADSIRAKSPDLFAHRYRVGHSIQPLDVKGINGETRPLQVHLWYPALGAEDCQDSDHSDENGHDQGGASRNGLEPREPEGERRDDCSAKPSVYTSRLNGVPLGSLGDPLSWTIGSSKSFENLPISRAHRSFPVIIFSHGNTNDAIDYVYTLEDLASFGFIVAAPGHVNNTQDDVRIDFVNSKAGFKLIPCFDGLPSPCSHSSIPERFTDRVHDVSAVIDELPIWFGDRADLSRVGVMGHSIGTVTALAAAGGSTTWGLRADRRVKAIMGLAIGATTQVSFAPNIQNITVPALLVAGSLDMAAPAAISQEAVAMLGSKEKAFVLIEDAMHRHFVSGKCAQTQSSGAIAMANPSAILDLQTVTAALISPLTGVAMDCCRYETFIKPVNIIPLVASLTNFNVTATDVPRVFDGDERQGLDSDQVKDKVVQLAVIFFGHALDRDRDDDRPFTDFLP